MTLVTLLACALPLPSQEKPQEAKPAPTISYIRAGRLFDSPTGDLHPNMVIIVEGERIQKVATTPNNL